MAKKKSKKKVSSSKKKARKTNSSRGQTPANRSAQEVDEDGLILPVRMNEDGTWPTNPWFDRPDPNWPEPDTPYWRPAKVPGFGPNGYGDYWDDWPGLSTPTVPQPGDPDFEGPVITPPPPTDFEDPNEPEPDWDTPTSEPPPRPGFGRGPEVVDDPLWLEAIGSPPQRKPKAKPKAKAKPRAKPKAKPKAKKTVTKKAAKKSVSQGRGKGRGRGRGRGRSRGRK